MAVGVVDLMENQWLDKHWPNWRWWGEFIFYAILSVIVLGLLAFTITCIAEIS